MEIEKANLFKYTKHIFDILLNVFFINFTIYQN